jgi:PAS domain S-box-containing protein
MIHPVKYEEQSASDAHNLQVKNWMTPCNHYLTPDINLMEAARQMEMLETDCLPVLDKDHNFCGMVTAKQLLCMLLDGRNKEDKLREGLNWNGESASAEDSILAASLQPYFPLPVLDKKDRLIGILTYRNIQQALVQYVDKLHQQENSAEALRAILESAYEGIAVVDENGILQEFNEAYSRFTGIRREEAVGSHVTEVIDNTNLHRTVKTGCAERGVLQNIQGQDMVVHRIPIWKDGKVAGAIGMLIFEGVTEMYRMYEKLQENHRKTAELPSGDKHKKESTITLEQIIGTSENLLKVKRMARKAARTAATVLITGESGTGKEMFAKSIHQLSQVSKGPFISINCGAIPEHLFESELFGYEEGAFTGAKKGGKPGKFELANHGTLFLDEIGEMPLVMQTKLLRVLQEKEVERVGSVKKQPITVRIIAATNTDIKELADTGAFRKDLYYRLNIINLHIPPLRERQKDIPILMAHYMQEVSGKYSLPPKSFASEAVFAFMDYQWPGNIRELVNSIERLVTLVDGSKIEQEHLPAFLKQDIMENTEEDEAHYSPANLIQEAKAHGEVKEKEAIMNALRRAGGNKSLAANYLGVHRTTLYQKMKKHRIH